MQSNFFETTFGFIIMAGFLLFGIGALYWLWLSIQIGSFWMFVFGVFPPTGVIASVVGAYAIFFGLPDWVYSFF